MQNKHSIPSSFLLPSRNIPYVCQQCKQSFLGRQGRQFCNRQCHSLHQKTIRLAEKNPNWKGSHAAPTSGRYRAKKLYPSNLCGICGEDGERHHVDANLLNNSPTNVVFLCRRHHMETDGRLRNLVKRNHSGAGRISGRIPWNKGLTKETHPNLNWKEEICHESQSS